jgi:hypothetical protein
MNVKQRSGLFGKGKTKSGIIITPFVVFLIDKMWLKMTKAKRFCF